MLLPQKDVTLGLIKIPFPNHPKPQFCTVFYEAAKHFQFFGGKIAQQEDPKLFQHFARLLQPKEDDLIRVCFARTLTEKLGYSGKEAQLKIKTFYNAITNKRSQHLGEVNCTGYAPDSEHNREYTFNLFLPYFKGFSFNDIILEVSRIPTIRWYDCDALMTNKDQSGNPIMKELFYKDNDPEKEKIALATVIELFLRDRDSSLAYLPSSI
ncbi:hypothetical protein ACFL35_21150 [Candidatus Riflebacteria bacterium]